MGKWGTKDIDTNICKVALFISRNKDNKDVENFKQRRFSFLISENRHDYNEYLGETFTRFVNEGVKGETSRCYVSVNPRDLNKVKKALIHNLIDDENNRMIINPLPYIAGIAALSENRADNKWLIDVDTTDPSILNNIRSMLINELDVPILEIIGTPNGYHIIVEHGFDSRILKEKYPECVEIKRDDMKLMYINKKL